MPALATGSTSQGVAASPARSVRWHTQRRKGLASYTATRRTPMVTAIAAA